MYTNGCIIQVMSSKRAKKKGGGGEELFLQHDLIFDGFEVVE